MILKTDFDLIKYSFKAAFLIGFIIFIYLLNDEGAVRIINACAGEGFCYGLLYGVVGLGTVFVSSILIGFLSFHLLRKNRGSLTIPACFFLALTDAFCFVLISNLFFVCLLFLVYYVPLQQCTSFNDALALYLNRNPPTLFQDFAFSLIACLLGVFYGSISSAIWREKKISCKHAALLFSLLLVSPLIFFELDFNYQYIKSFFKCFVEMEPLFFQYSSSDQRFTVLLQNRLGKPIAALGVNATDELSNRSCYGSASACGMQGLGPPNIIPAGGIIKVELFCPEKKNQGDYYEFSLDLRYIDPEISSISDVNSSKHAYICPLRGRVG
jgi:hypothetical protein